MHIPSHSLDYYNPIAPKLQELYLLIISFYRILYKREPRRVRRGGEAILRCWIIADQRYQGADNQGAEGGAQPQAAGL